MHRDQQRGSDSPIVVFRCYRVTQSMSHRTAIDAGPPTSQRPWRVGGWQICQSRSRRCNTFPARAETVAVALSSWNVTQRSGSIYNGAIRGVDREDTYSDLATRVALLCVTRRRPDFELFPLMPSLTVERSVRQLQVLAILQHSHLS